MNSTAATRSSSFYLLWLLPLLAFFINTFLPQLAYGQTIPMFVPQFGNYTLSSSNNLYCSDMFVSSIIITEGQSVVPGGGSEINCALACDEAKDRCAGFDVLKGTGKTQCNFYSKSSCDNLSSQLTSTGWILSAAYYSRTKPYVTGQIFPGIGRTIVAGGLGSPGAAVNLSFQDFVGFDMSASSCQNVTYTVVPAVGYDAQQQPIVYALPQGLTVSNNSVQGTLPPNPFAIGFVAQCADGTTATSILASPRTYGTGSAGVPLASYTGTTTAGSTSGTTGTTAGTTSGTIGTGTTASTTSGTTGTGTTASTTSGTIGTGTTAGTTSGTTGTTASTTSGTTGATAGTTLGATTSGATTSNGICGDGFIDPGEACDLGASNSAGNGCNNCQVTDSSWICSNTFSQYDQMITSSTNSDSLKSLYSLLADLTIAATVPANGHISSATADANCQVTTITPTWAPACSQYKKDITKFKQLNINNSIQTAFGSAAVTPACNNGTPFYDNSINPAGSYTINCIPVAGKIN